jgi:hypothetical protein
MRAPILLALIAAALIGTGVFMLSTAPMHVPDPSHAEKTPALFECSIEGNTVSLSGFLPNTRTREALLYTTQTAFPRKTLHDNTRTDTTVLAASWSPRWHAVLRAVRDTESDLFLQVQNDSLRLYGVLSDPVARRDLVLRTRLAMSGHLVVVDMLTSGTLRRFDR